MSAERILSQGLTLNIIRDANTCIIKKGRSKIQIEYQIIVIYGWGNFVRITNNKRQTKRLFVHKSFIEPTMFSQIKALIRSVNDNGVFT